MIVAFMATTHGPLGMLCALTSLFVLEAIGVPLPASPAECAVLALVVGSFGGLLPDLDRHTSRSANAGQQVGGTVNRGMGFAGKAMFRLVRRRSFAGVLISLLLGGFSFLVTAIFEGINLPVNAAASYIERRLGHRGPLHSVVAAILLSLGYTGLVVLLTGYGLYIWLAVVVAYLLLPLLVALLVLASSRGLWLLLLTVLLVVVLSFGVGAVLNREAGTLAVLHSLDLSQLAGLAAHCWQAGSKWQVVGWFVFAGIISHFLGDGCCKSSVRCLWWPLAYRDEYKQAHGLPFPLAFRPWPKPLRVRAQSWQGEMVGHLATAVIVVLLLVSLDGGATTTFLSRLIGGQRR